MAQSITAANPSHYEKWLVRRRNLYQNKWVNSPQILSTADLYYFIIVALIGLVDRNLG